MALRFCWQPFCKEAQSLTTAHNRREFLRAMRGAASLGLASSVRLFGRSRALRLSGTIAIPEGPGGHDRLQPDWYRKKIAQVQAEMAKDQLDALVLLNAHNIIYTTGYFHISTERPLAALIPKTGDPALFIPELEVDQVKLWWVKDYEAYFDFPGPVNRVRWIFERVARRGLSHGRIGIEGATAANLKQMKAGAPHATLLEAGDLIEHLRWIKDDAELA